MQPRSLAAALRAATLALCVPFGSATAQSYTDTLGALAPYRVECPGAGLGDDETGGVASAPCVTDLATFIGRRVFDAHCASCHGSDALGSRFAPALPERVRRLDRAAFLRMLERGYPGAAGMLPRWGEIPDVDRYADALWAYLLARASGDLPPGPIELLPDAAIR